jgi:hypothetical protein
MGGHARHGIVHLNLGCGYLAMITCVEASGGMTCGVQGRWLRTADLYYLCLVRCSLITSQQAFQKLLLIHKCTLLASPGPTLLPQTLRGAAVQWGGPGHLLALLHTCSTSGHSSK